VQLTVTAPANNNYTFALFAPGTSDATFPQASSFSEGNTNGYASSVIDLQAPYNGTFLLAVCENAGNCPGAYPGGGTSPMDPYTFTPTFIARVPATVAARETKAGTTVDGAPQLPLGNFEAGGGGPFDFWHVSLRGGDRVQLTVTAPANNNYTFALFAPGTSDATFPQASSFSEGNTNGYAKSIIDLQAPYNGTFLLAVCENAGNCPGAYPGGGTSPMDPYTFTTRLVGGRETSTSLKLSASVVTYGKEKSLKFSVSVRAVFGGHPTGKVYVSDGKKRICGVQLVNGKGTCSPASNTAIPVGRYAMTATYTGNLLGSKSGVVTLTVKK
jgi:Bacterial Ig-like domain (group 3)